MSKKLTFTLILTAFLTLFFGTAALAAGEGPDAPDGPRGVRRGIGQVLAIGEDNLTLDTPRFGEQTIYFDEETRFGTPDGEGSVADIEVGRWVAVVLPRDAGDQPTARAIILLPEDFDPANRVRAAGEITALDADSISLTTLKGEALTLQITEQTRFKGKIESLDDLEVGMMVAVLGQAQEDGSVRAALVYHGKPPLHRLPRFGGTVTAVDTEAGTFTLENRQGETRTFQVGERTRFRSRDGEFDSFEDIETGMILAVRGFQTEDGQYQAVRVIQLQIEPAAGDGQDSGG